MAIKTPRERFADFIRDCSANRVSLTVTIGIRCDHRDPDGYCGSAFRSNRPGTLAEVRREAAGYGWWLGERDLCPRCAGRESSCDPGGSEAV